MLNTSNSYNNEWDTGLTSVFWEHYSRSVEWPRIIPTRRQYLTCSKYLFHCLPISNYMSFKHKRCLSQLGHGRAFCVFLLFIIYVGFHLTVFLFSYYIYYKFFVNCLVLLIIYVLVVYVWDCSEIHRCASLRLCARMYLLSAKLIKEI